MKKLLALVMLFGCGAVQADVIHYKFDGYLTSLAVDIYALDSATVSFNYFYDSVSNYHLGYIDFSNRVDGHSAVTKQMIEPLLFPTWSTGGFYSSTQGFDFTSNHTPSTTRPFGLVQGGELDGLDWRIATFATTRTTQFGCNSQGLTYGVDCGEKVFSSINFKNIAGGGADYLVTITSASSSIIPIPAAVWLFGSGLGMLGWMRKRRMGALI